MPLIDSSTNTIATQYGQFAYEFCKAEPELAATAIEAIKNLGETPAAQFGGIIFRNLHRCLGWPTAIAFRKRLKPQNLS